MDSSLFDYDLPPEAIAQEPSQRREDSQLLVIHRKSGLVQSHSFRDLPQLLEGKWNFVRNNVKVLRARMKGQRRTGGKVECLLVHPSTEDPEKTWWCLLKPAKRLSIGEEFSIAEDLQATVLEKAPDGIIKVQFSSTSNLTVPELSERYGQMPLPPYIRREENDPRGRLDNERYQTVYANPQKPFAAAAPTAGLHFSPEIIDRLKEQQHLFHDLTLHVGIGTFKPIQVERLQDHDMHEEHYEIPAATAKTLQTENILAIGTTSLRAIEDAYRKQLLEPGTKPKTIVESADLFLYPPCNFRTDALLTNFHLPKSTLLCLVSAFLTPDATEGIEWLKQIYRAALEADYRFYSYGDAMLIL